MSSCSTPPPPLKLVETPSIESETFAFMPLATLPARDTISLQRTKQILAQLSSQQQRLATNTAFFRQHSSDIHSVAGHLRDHYMAHPVKCKKLLQREPQLLKQLAQVLAAALQQLADQRDTEIEVSRAVASLGDVLSWLLTATKVKSSQPIAPSSPADTANLRILRDTGLLGALAAASQVAGTFWRSGPKIPRLDPATASKAAIAAQLEDNTVQVFAAASCRLVSIWCCTGELMCALELMFPNSFMLDSLLPVAALAMQLARAYAADKAFCAAVLHTVLMAATAIARAAVGAPDHPDDALRSVQGRREVLDLMLLAFAVGTEQLHAKSQGASQQVLLPSLRTASSSTTSSGGSGGSSSSGSGRKSKKTSKSRPSDGRYLAVSPHHQELLQVLVGVRQLTALHTGTASRVLSQMSLIPLAVNSAVISRVNEARSSSSMSSSTQAIRDGELVPWQLALPSYLVRLEVLSLAPPYFAKQLAQMNILMTQLLELVPQVHQLAQVAALQGLLPPNMPPAATIKAHAQLCVHSVWLELGPVLLSLCRRSSGETAGADDVADWGPVADPGMLGMSPREVFATYSKVLFDLLVLRANGLHAPPVSLAAVVLQDPVLACMVAEAALRAAPAFTSNDFMQPAGNVCFAARLLTDSAADAAVSTACKALTVGEQATAAAPQDSCGQRLNQQMLCLLVAALKFLQLCAARGSGAVELDIYYHRLGLLASCCSAALLLAGDGSCSDMYRGWTYGMSATPATAAPAGAGAGAGPGSELVWLHALGRCLIAAGQLLQQVPIWVSPTGGLVLRDMRRQTETQLKSFKMLTRVLVGAVMSMHNMLQPGGAAAAAITAGSPAPAAATAKDLARLQKQAAELQQQLAAIHKQMSPEDYDAAVNWAGHSPKAAADSMMISSQATSALQQLHAACVSGKLPQDLHSFGVACCAAFPQHGCCGNPACTSLDKFSEVALASLACTGCNKAVKFCSATCSKTAWKHGHKAACTALKQRQAAAPAAADN